MKLGKAADRSVANSESCEDSCCSIHCCGQLLFTDPASPANLNPEPQQIMSLCRTPLLTLLTCPTSTECTHVKRLHAQGRHQLFCSCRAAKEQLFLRDTTPKACIPMHLTKRSSCNGVPVGEQPWDANFCELSQARQAALKPTAIAPSHLLWSSCHTMTEPPYPPRPIPCCAECLCSC